MNLSFVSFEGASALELSFTEGAVVLEGSLEMGSFNVVLHL